jgi:hypothetical protein
MRFVKSPYVPESHGQRETKIVLNSVSITYSSQAAPEALTVIATVNMGLNPIT